MEEIIERFDDAISARLDEYDQYFFGKLEEFVTEWGLVPSREASGIQSCPAVYFPTHPGVTPTKSYDFGLHVALNGPSSGPTLIRQNTELRGNEGLPKISELDENKLAPARLQNQHRNGTTSSHSSYCVLPSRPGNLPRHGRHFLSDCSHTYKYASALMRDTYTDMDGNHFRGYWIVEPHLDPNHHTLLNEANANAYGNSLGRRVAFNNMGQQLAGDTYQVSCDNFDYIMPLGEGDAETISESISKAERTHERTGPGGLLFRKR